MRVQLIMTGAVAALIGLMFVLLVELDFPFRRDSAISPDRWLELERYIDITGDALAPGSAPSPQAVWLNSAYSARLPEPADEHRALEKGAMPHRRTTFSKFIIEDQRRRTTGDAELTALLNDVQTACKFVASAVSRGQIDQARGLADDRERDRPARMRMGWRFVRYAFRGSEPLPYVVPGNVPARPIPARLRSARRRRIIWT